MAFVGSASDFQQLGVAPKTFDVVFANVTIATQYLNGSIGDLFRHVGAVQFRAVGVETAIK
jgi:hypothetical protein